MFFVSIGCSKNRVEQRVDTMMLAKNDPAIVDSRADELVKTILNLPGVVKYSKVEFIQEEYDEIFVRFDPPSPTFGDSVIFQNTFSLKVIKDIAPPNKPCYVFKKIDIQGNTAYVVLHFDITGFVCHGTLNYVEGKWMPDKTFKVGYR